MLLSKLPKLVQTAKKRLGRGFGSGVGGHTVGRGQKGQKTRGVIPLWFEGGQLPLVRRTPFIKGKHRFQVINLQPVTVNFDRLSKFEDKTIVDAGFLVVALKISEKEAKRGFKIIATGKLTKALEVNVPASAGAIKAIEAAGGKYIYKAE
jgi:large subunit ribosomal protein L15